MPGAARLGDKAQVDSDAHGCPACPHPAVGPIVTGSPNVFVNKKPSARKDDLGIHAVCCGANNYSLVKGSPTVYVNNKPMARLNDKTKHCGGSGPIIDGSPNVLIDDGATAAGALAQILAAAREIARQVAAANAKAQAKKAADQHRGNSAGKGGKGGAAGGGGGDLGKNVAPGKTQDDPAADKFWFEIEAVDDGGKPLANARFVLIDGNGKERRGKLDERGKVRLEGLPKGDVALSFIDFDKSAVSLRRVE